MCKKFNFQVLIVFLLAFSSCASKVREKEKTNECNCNQFPLEVKIHPGHIRFIKLDVTDYDFSEKSELVCHGEKIPYEYKKGIISTYVRYSYFSPKKPFVCMLKEGKNSLVVVQFVMDKYEYQSERLFVDKKRLFLSKEDQARAWREQQILNKIYANSPNFFYFNQSFQEPLDSYVTSRYGKKRIYNNKKQSQHLGTDYRAAVGIKIPAANRGKIVLARDLFYTGNTVILDHGFGIFTVYGHLSKILVKENDIAAKGDILGLSGKTGRVTGPHLHWGVKVGGQYIDGPMLVQESRKQFKSE